MITTFLSVLSWLSIGFLWGLFFITARSLFSVIELNPQPSTFSQTLLLVILSVLGPLGIPISLVVSLIALLWDGIDGKSKV